MHGDVREAQNLAVMRLADESPGELQAYPAGGAELTSVSSMSPQQAAAVGTPPTPPFSLPGTSNSSCLVPGIHDDLLFAQLLARRTNTSSTGGSTDGRGEPSFPKRGSPSAPPTLGSQPPLTTNSSHAVPLPDGDASKVGHVGLAGAWNASLALPPYRDHMGLVPPRAMLQPSYMHRMPQPMSHSAQLMMHFTPQAPHFAALPPGHPLTSHGSEVSLVPSSSTPPDGTSLLPSPGSSLLSSNMPSAYPSEQPSPAMLPVPLGSAVTSPPPQHLPPPLLTAALLERAPQACSISPVDAATAAPMNACFFDSFILAPQDQSGVGGCGADSSTSTSSGYGSRFSDILGMDDAETGTASASTTFTRNSIAKQLSVLFGDGGSSAQNLTLLGKTDLEAGTATQQATSDDGRTPSPLEPLGALTLDGPSANDTVPDELIS